MPRTTIFTGTFIGKKPVVTRGNSNTITLPPIYFENFAMQNNAKKVIAFEVYLDNEFIMTLKPVVVDENKEEAKENEPSINDT